MENQAQPGSAPLCMAPELTEPQMPPMAYNSATAVSHEAAPKEEGDKLELDTAGCAQGEARRTARGLKENSPPVSPHSPPRAKWPPATKSAPPVQAPKPSRTHSLRKDRSGALRTAPSASQQTPPRRVRQQTPPRHEDQRTPPSRVSQRTAAGCTSEQTPPSGVSTPSTSGTHTPRSRFTVADVLSPASPLISLSNFHTSGAYRLC